LRPRAEVGARTDGVQLHARPHCADGPARTAEFLIRDALVCCPRASPCTPRMWSAAPV